MTTNKKDRRIDFNKVIQVELLEAKPNKMFSEWQTQTLRFLRYSHPVPCGECGRRSKHHWTVLYTFEAKNMESFALMGSGKIHMPLTPVCRNHLLAPAEPPEEKRVPTTR